MAPSITASSQQLLGQAAEQLVQAVRATGQAPNDFAEALLDLVEVLAKVAEFDEMAAAASVEAASDEAKQWQEISLLTLTFCRQSLVEEQQRAIKKVCAFAEQGASLFKNLEVAAPTVEGSKVSPAAAVPEPAPCARPPGVWATKPPPGLAPPPGLSGPPGLELCTKASDKKAKTGGTSQPKRTPPWRKLPVEPMEVAAKEPECALNLNLDAYSDGGDSS